MSSCWHLHRCERRYRYLEVVVDDDEFVSVSGCLAVHFSGFVGVMLDEFNVDAIYVFDNSSPYSTASSSASFAYLKCCHLRCRILTILLDASVSPTSITQSMVQTSMTLSISMR